MNSKKLFNNTFLLDSEFFHNTTGIGQDSEHILETLRSEWDTEETSSRFVFKGRGHWRRKFLTLLWFLRLGHIYASGSSNTIFYQSQIGIFRPPLDSKDWIIRIHDLFPITNPEWFHVWSRYLFRHSLDFAIQWGAGFIANSETTKNVLSSYAPQEIRIEVLPCKTRTFSNISCGNCLGCEWVKKYCADPFALALGTIEPRKNYPALISSWDRRPKQTCKLLIVGKFGWKSRETRRALRKSHSVEHIEICCDGALFFMFKNCVAFISASHSEGFDLPTMEARQFFSLPLILSDIPVHREFHNDVGYFFKNTDELINLELGKIPHSEQSTYYPDKGPLIAFKGLLRH